MAQREPRDMSWARSLALVGQIGFVVVIPIVAGVFAGLYLFRRFGSALLFVACIVLGVVGGLLAAYRLLAKEIDWDR